MNELLSCLAPTLSFITISPLSSRRHVTWHIIIKLRKWNFTFIFLFKIYCSLFGVTYIWMWISSGSAFEWNICKWMSFKLNSIKVINSNWLKINRRPIDSERINEKSTFILDVKVSWWTQWKLMKNHKPAGQFNGTSFRHNNIRWSVLCYKVWRNDHIQISNLWTKSMHKFIN